MSALIGEDQKWSAQFPRRQTCDRAMVKEAKFFRKQAAKAERMARTVADAEISERYQNMANAYRSQADVLEAKKKPRLKAKKKSGKKRR